MLSALGQKHREANRQVRQFRRQTSDRQKHHPDMKQICNRQEPLVTHRMTMKVKQLSEDST